MKLPAINLKEGISMRFRKSITICKGVRVNFSKSGPSLTVGGRGASVNVGGKGAFLNTSIPGTGLYDRVQIGGGSSKKGTSHSGKPKQASGASRAGTDAYGHPLPPKSITIEYLDDGSAIIKDENGIEVTDSYVLRKLKATEQYKKEIERLSKQRLENSEAEIQEFVGIYRKSCRVYTIDDYKNEVEYLQNLKYEKHEFSELEPDENVIRQSLQDKAEHEINTLKFWKKKELVDEYVNEHLRETIIEAWVCWERNKQNFEKQEEKAESEFYAENTRKAEHISKLLANEPDAVSNAVDSWLKSVEFPFGFSVDFDIKDSMLLVDLDLPEIEDMPLQYARQMADGSVKMKNRSKKAMREDYFQCVLGLGLFIASNLLGTAVGIEKIILSAYTQRADAKGLVNDDYIYSVKFDRSKMADVDWDNGLSEIFFGFEHRCEVRADKSFKTIIPFEE